VRGDTLEGGDTRVKVIKSDSDSNSGDEQKRSSVFEQKITGVTQQNWRLKKVARFFSGKSRGVTPLVTAPGVTHPSDATV